jgi:hypothetical protein
VANRRFTQEEIEFIEQNYRFRTDKEIAHILGRTEQAIMRQRDIHGWKKGNGRPTQKDVKENTQKAVDEGLNPFSFAGLDKDQRIEVYKTQFNRGPRYSQLMAELHTDELQFYRHRYIEIMMTLDTITMTEEDSLHHMLITDIYISRMRRRIKEMETENQNGSNSPLVFGMYTHLRELEDKFLKYQQILRVTREGRLKEDKEQKETFASLIQMYRNKATKEEMGNQASLMDVYKNKCYEEMKVSRYLLGETGV